VVPSYDLKLDRTNEHIEAVERCVEDWLRTDAYTIVREINPETGDTVRRAKIKRPPPPELSLLIGDAIHNLRSALDHAVYFLAERNLGTLTPEIEHALMFPIVGNENSKGAPADGATIIDDLMERTLIGVPGPARDFIKREQPYHWGDGYGFHWLWSVYNLDRIDKHRRLAVTTAFLGVPGVGVPENFAGRLTFARAEGPINDGDIIVTYSGPEEDIYAYLPRSVAINEGTAGDREAVAHLRNLQQRVEWIVRVLGESPLH
jgi:hypothetical protein